MNIKITIILSLSLLMFISNSAVAGKIYKWVDENGDTHYSSKKSTKNKSKTMDLPDSTKTQIQTNSNIDDGECKTITCRMNKYVNDNPIKKRKRQRRRTDSSSLSASDVKKVRDAAIAKCKQRRDSSCDGSRKEPQRRERKKVKKIDIVSKCKQNRDIFCDKGAEEIQRIDREKAEAQRRAARERKLNPYVPRYKGNDIHIQ